MDEEKINSLAREYAEDHVEPHGFSESTYKELLEEKSEMAGCVLRWLSSRFCVVEKSKVQEEYNLALSNFEKAGWARPLNRSYYDGRSDAIKAIFPEIAKDVSHE